MVPYDFSMTDEQIYETRRAKVQQSEGYKPYRVRQEESAARMRNAGVWPGPARDVRRFNET
jgi:hypothetical protein